MLGFIIPIVILWNSKALEAKKNYHVAVRSNGTRAENGYRLAVIFMQRE